jgi:transglutaminase-like putative cysteine protease
MWLQRIFIGGVVLFASLSAGATTAWAKDFRADYSVTYKLNTESKLMHVTQKVTLTNLAPNMRASSYSLTLENNSYKHLTARDGGGALKYTESKNDSGPPVLSFTFNDRVVGQGNKLTWTIEYDSSTLAQQHGQTWDVTIPRVKEHPSYEIGSYNVLLQVPKSVGPPAFVSPAIAKDESNDTDHLYSFTKDQVLPTGIVATFGKAQLFRFTLKYHLKNPYLGQSSTTIALPPDIPGYQQIIYDSLLPKPIKLELDKDGNAMATYYVASHAELDVTFTGWARTIANKPDLSNKALAKELPPELVSTYTSEQEFWQTSDPDIVKKTHEITNPDKPVVENARAIYNYVTTTLKYDTARINEDLRRLGASEAFDHPEKAVCMEFTDVFVTMARIAGIPAREVDGYAYTSDAANHPIYYPGLGSDILHAWAEVYLPGSGWVMVDPTWGSTTGGVDFFGRIDLNRIAFAIKGISSTEPFAAGSYKTNDQQDGDVSVHFAADPVTPRLDLDLSLRDSQVIAGIGSTLPLEVSNKGNATLYDLELAADLPQLLRLTRKIELPEAILPGQTTTIWLPMGSDSWLSSTSTKLPLTLSAHDIATTKTSQQIRPTISLTPFIAAIIVPILLLIALVAAAIGGGWFGLHRWYHKTEADIKES